MSRKRPNVIINVINVALFLLIIMGFGTGILITAVQLALNRGVTFSRPHPTPLSISLTYLPLPVVEITPVPGSGNLPDEGTFNSRIEIYTNRFGGQWMNNEEIRFYFVPERVDTISLRQWGVFQDHEWGVYLDFPWPSAPFSGELTQNIRGSVSVLLNSRAIDHGTRGPAVAEFNEIDPAISFNEYLAQCRYHVHGQITLTSYSPVVGNFQFACQFDATEYALVSGWFWE